MSDAEFCGSRRSRRTRSGNFWNPTGLFTGGEQGAWYDPSDLTTLFQDAAGTTAVTAVEQPVSLMLDKRLGGLNALGPELVTNGDFSNGTTGWTPNNVSQSVVDGKLLVTVTTVGDSYSRQTISGLTAGRIYKVTGLANPTQACRVRANLVAANTAYIYATGAEQTFALYFVATATTAVISLELASDGSWMLVGRSATFDNISVREVPGNHAYTPSSASTSRPVLSARVNQLTATEDFSNAAWAKSAVTISTDASTAPNGTTTADAVIPSASTSVHRLGQLYTLTGVTSATYTVFAKANGYNRVALLDPQHSASSSAMVDLHDGTMINPANVNGTTTATAVGAGWYRITWNQTNLPAGAVNYTIAVAVLPDSGITNTNSGTWLGDGVSSVLLWGADARVTNDGVGLPVYQRVTTSTDYDTTGFPLYLRADGSDDYMLTSSIDFSATDKVTVVAGLRKLADPTYACFVELSSSSATNTGMFHSFAPAGGDGVAYNFLSRGSAAGVPVGPASAAYPAPITNVLTGVANIAAPVVTMRLNGTQVATSATTQGTGNYGNYPLYLFRRGGTTLPFNGRFYGLVVRGAATDTGTLQQTEAFLNNKTRAY